MSLVTFNQSPPLSKHFVIVYAFIVILVHLSSNRTRLLYKANTQHHHRFSTIHLFHARSPCASRPNQSYLYLYSSSSFIFLLWGQARTPASLAVQQTKSLQQRSVASEITAPGTKIIPYRLSACCQRTRLGMRTVLVSSVGAHPSI